MLSSKDACVAQVNEEQTSSALQFWLNAGKSAYLWLRFEPFCLLSHFLKSIYLVQQRLDQVTDSFGLADSQELTFFFILTSQKRRDVTA